MGTLTGLRVVEFAGLGPAPHAAMILADHGADVITVQRPGTAATGMTGMTEMVKRGRTIVGANLKDEADRAKVIDLISKADVLIEGFRPGVMERLGLGPEPLLEINPKLVYARMTGYGQTGPLANAAGHDMNYLALTGLLNAIGRKGERPVPPLNLVADFGGGSMFLLFGVLAALFERQTSGKGQVVDVAMVDGASVLGQMQWDFRGQGMWSDVKGENGLDGGAPFYDTYETSDGKYLAVGAIEPQFFAQFVALLGLDIEQLPFQLDIPEWGAMKKTFGDVIATKTRDEWAEIFEGTDACVAPILSFEEAPTHPHMVARGNLALIEDVMQPMPAPRFSRTPAPAPTPPPKEPTNIDDVWTDVHAR